MTNPNPRDPKIWELWSSGALPLGSLSGVDIVHDASCGIYERAHCDCQPAVRLRLQDDAPMRGRRKDRKY